MFVETEAIYISEKRTEKKSYQMMGTLAMNEASVGQKLMESSSHLHEVLTIFDMEPDNWAKLDRKKSSYERENCF